MVAAPLKPEVLERTVYVCSVCGTRYDLHRDAQACADQPTDPERYKVGDIVIRGYGYKWFNGDRRWIENKSLMKRRGWKDLQRQCTRNRNCMERCCTLGFYYVVTKVDRCPQDRHRVRYHLATGALAPAPGHRAAGGFTYNEQHGSLILIRRPPKEVVRLSKAFLGFESGHLI